MVAGTAPSSKVEIVYLRDGKERTVSAQLGELNGEPTGNDGEESEPASVGDLGLKVQPLTPALAKQFGYEAGDEGVVVTGIEDGSLAAEAGLQEGDLITEVNRQKVTTAGDFRAATGKSKDKGITLLLVKNPKGGSRFMLIKSK